MTRNQVKKRICTTTANVFFFHVHTELSVASVIYLAVILSTSRPITTSQLYSIYIVRASFPCITSCIRDEEEPPAFDFPQPPTKMADHQQPALDVDAARADLLRRQIRIAIETVFRLQREQGDPISWEVYNLQPRETPGEIILTEEEVDILMTDEVLVRELGRFIAQEIDGVNVGDDDDEADDQESEPDEELALCQVCFETIDLSVNEYLQCACGETWCSDCTSRAFAVAVEDRSQWPIRCECGAITNVDAASHVLPPTFLEQNRRRFQEWNAILPLYCGKQTCSVFLLDMATRAAGPQPDKFVQCNECRSKTCTQCKASRKNHTKKGKCRRRTLAHTAQNLVTNSESRACRCGHVIERNGGCRHMTCSGCTYEFCFVCGARWWTCDCEMFDPEDAEDIDEDVNAQ